MTVTQLLSAQVPTRDEEVAAEHKRVAARASPEQIADIGGSAIGLSADSDRAGTLLW